MEEQQPVLPQLLRLNAEVAALDTKVEAAVEKMEAATADRGSMITWWQRDGT